MVAEITVVITALAMFKNVFFPDCGDVFENKIKQATCAMNMKRLSCAMLQYACDHENVIPFTSRVDIIKGKKRGVLWWRSDPGSPLAPKYIKDMKPWVICPSFDIKKFLNYSHCSYQKRFHLGVVTDQVGKNNTERILMAESNEKGAYGGFGGKVHFDRLGFPHDGGANVLLVNGDVKWMKPWTLYNSLYGKINYPLSEKLRRDYSKNIPVKTPKIFAGDKELIAAYSSFCKCKTGDNKKYDYTIAIRKLEKCLKTTKKKKPVLYLLSFSWLMKGNIDKACFYAKKLNNEKTVLPDKDKRIYSLLKNYTDKLVTIGDYQKELERLRFMLLKSRKIPFEFNHLQEEINTLQQLNGEIKSYPDPELEKTLASIKNNLLKLLDEWQVNLPSSEDLNHEYWINLQEKANQLRNEIHEFKKKIVQLKMNTFWKTKNK